MSKKLECEMSGPRPVCPLWVGVQEVSLNPKTVKSVDTGEWK